MAHAFKTPGVCPECGCEILIEVTPVEDHPEIGAGHDLTVNGTVCVYCGSIVGGTAEITLQLEAWDAAD